MITISFRTTSVWGGVVAVHPQMGSRKEQKKTPFNFIQRCVCVLMCFKGDSKYCHF